MNEKADYEQLWSQAWGELQKLGPLTHTNHRLIMKVLRPHLVEGARILDVGRGNGALLTKLSRKFPTLKLARLEGSEQVVARAQESLGNRIVRQDLTNGFSLGAAPFDVVICSEVLEHLSDYRPALVSIAAHTLSGGHVLITVPHSMPYWSKADEFAGHYRRFEFQEFRESLRQCALVPVRYFTWGFPIAYFYYQAVTKIEPARLMCSGESRLRAFAARMLYHAMKIDDLFTGKRWHQLIALARKDSTTAKRRW